MVNHLRLFIEHLKRSKNSFVVSPAFSHSHKIDCIYFTNKYKQTSLYYLYIISHIPTDYYSHIIQYNNECKIHIQYECIYAKTNPTSFIEYFR